MGTVPSAYSHLIVGALFGGMWVILNYAFDEPLVEDTTQIPRIRKLRLPGLLAGGVGIAILFLGDAALHVWPLVILICAALVAVTSGGPARRALIAAKPIKGQAPRLSR